MSVEREVEQLDGVAAGDLVHDLGVEVAEQFVSDFFRAWEGPVAVGVVGLEEHIVDADLVEQLHASRVLEEAAVDLAVVVVRRRLGQTLLALRPHVRLVVVVGAFEVYGIQPIWLSAYISFRFG